MKRHALILSLLFLSACSLTSPRDVGKAKMFTLPAVEDVTVARRNPAALEVRYPTVSSELDTYRIAVTTADKRHDYFAGSRWSEFLPELVMASVQESFEASQGYERVVPDGQGGAGAYRLSVEVLECRAVYSAAKRPPEVIIHMTFNLVTPDGKGPVRHLDVEKRARAVHNNSASIAAAFAQAFSDMMSEVIPGMTSYARRG